MKKLIHCMGCLFIWSRGKTADFDMLSAAAHGDNNRVRILLREGIKPNVAGVMGITPLMRAAKKGYVDTANLLLDAGADVNATDSAGYSPLMMAAEKGHVDVVKALIARGANVNQKAGASTALSLASAQMSDHSMDYETCSAIVKMLAEAGAKP